ncbi:Conidiation protein 6-domain-containing protein [Gloeopeniophorella convolvens]|nr:Conidiation protein 6-domain-containing protein [Gloeopeniophorella convolvens]
MSEQQHQNRVAGGHKAAAHNPNVSSEAKERSRQAAEEIQTTGVDNSSAESASSLNPDGKEENRVLGGYKATLKNPNVSDEAKQKAQRVLEENDA